MPTPSAAIVRSVSQLLLRKTGWYATLTLSPPSCFQYAGKGQPFQINAP
jgi:hypothetical protein